MTRPLQSQNRRQVLEPGGVLLVTVGLDDDQARNAAQTLYQEAGSLTLLIDPRQTSLAKWADEVWVYGPLGAAGFLALIRRISWRHFDGVFQPPSKDLPWLRFFIWPRPTWHRTQIGG